MATHPAGQSAMDRNRPLLLRKLPGFGNRAATVAMTAADGVLIPMVPGEGDVTEASRTVELVADVASAARRKIPARVILNRVRPSTTLSKHAAAEAESLPKLKAGLFQT